MPIFDCARNQANLCKLPSRKCQVGMENKLQYKYCQSCRGKSRYHEGGIELCWQPCVFMDEHFKHQMTLSAIRKKSKQFRGAYGKSLFELTHFPAFSASLLDIESAIDTLEFRKGFVPDVIIIDYADIINGDMRLDDTAMANRIWMALKGLAARRNALVITATQGNRASFQHETIQQTDMSWDIRKLAHADVVCGISQNPIEKAQKFIRLNVLVHRWRDFLEQQQLMILQQNDIGQTYLDSELVIKFAGD